MSWLPLPNGCVLLLFLTNRWFKHILSTQVSDTGPVVLWFINCIVTQHFMSQRMVKPTALDCTVWSVFSVCMKKLWVLATHTAPREDSDRTGQMLRLDWVLAWGTSHFVGFAVTWLRLYEPCHEITSSVYLCKHWCTAIVCASSESSDETAWMPRPSLVAYAISTMRSHGDQLEA